MNITRRASRRATLATASIGALALVIGTAGTAQAATAVGLGTADSFVVLAGAGVTNTGTTTLSGNLGAANGAVSGDTDLVFTSGVNHYGDGTTTGAMLDLETAFGAASQPADVTVSADLGGQILTPGVYFQAGPMNLSAPGLVLDAEGNPDAVWIFRAGSSLIVGPGASVTLVNGASACNVFWQVASSASLDDGASMVGTIIARTAITLNAAATVQGRVLALDANVSLINNTITRPVCAAPADTSTPVDTGTPTSAVAPNAVTAPVAAAQIGVAPTGGVSTGDGSTSAGADTTPYLLVGAIAVVAITVVAFGAMSAAAMRVRKRNS